MASFQAVNTTTLHVPDQAASRVGDETTPTTPRPNKFFSTERPHEDSSSAKTPTRDSFGGMSDQRPLPHDFAPSREMKSSPSRDAALSRESSHRSTKSESRDVEMGDEYDEHEGSEEESTSDPNKSNKKKKGQRFFCTDFPPCQLSFTRSEHLARHIRKHTGERPFQCHCSRRFSRLDNLRQHAQTVHVNEDIPGDSLAATGTRFQRQIRTDRVRPPTGRSRASTLSTSSAHTPHSRGHSRNLSTSSITSTASSISITPRDDSFRRRPAPLAMSSDSAARARLSLETYNPPLMGSPGPTFSTYGNQSPTGISTPTSATFSTNGSPNFPSGLHSPIANAPRALTWDNTAPQRRLSVPSGSNPFQGPAPPNAFIQYNTPLPSATSSTFSGNGSMFSSPTTSSFAESRRESVTDDWRRRTWHPSTYTNLDRRPATSGLSYYQTPDAPHPSSSNQPAASQTTRLPGIESFDHAPPPPVLTRRQPSPMQVDGPNKRPALSGPAETAAPRPYQRSRHIPHHSWDMSNGINKLEIGPPNPPREQQAAFHFPSPLPPQNAVRPVTAPHPGYSLNPNHQPSPIDQGQQQLTAEMGPGPEVPSTPSRSKRHGWYNGPLSVTYQPTPPVSQMTYNTLRTSPEDSSSSEGVHTPSTAPIAEFHPAIVHANGYVESTPPGVIHVEDQQKFRMPPVAERSNSSSVPSYTTPGPSVSEYRSRYDPVTRTLPPPGAASDTSRLEALVAVATGEQRAATATH